MAIPYAIRGIRTTKTIRGGIRVTRATKVISATKATLATQSMQLI
jgi:hypothetical protein